jgi:predicted O-methyltransferase YrrM
MRNYIFTENWFTGDGLNVLNEIDTTQELHILEIGSFEGKSTVWFLENILQNKKSSITCVDPWMNFSQDHDSLNSYYRENNDHDLVERKTKEVFLHNITESTYRDKVIVKQGLSNEVLPSLIVQKEKYDIIFIDGNHTAPYVMMDAVMSWSLLKEGGFMIFDDYNWDLHKPSTLRPKESIDYFMLTFADYATEVYSDYRKVIKKIR